MPTQQWVDEFDRRVTLGERVGPRGGEGEIFRIQGEPASVAKLYHQPADATKAEKLRRLRDLAKPVLTNIAAWPERLLFVASDRRQIAGFVMPFRAGQRVERLYNPRDRRKDYPKAGWDFLVHVARNCAAAFETLHEHGVLMADVNEGNVLVADDGLVRLIDCDSYQVIRPNGVALTCDVGVPLWTPPELQGRALNGVVRTPDHDRFGLAVLVFHLLFMGRHPYAGVPVSTQAEDIPIDIAIKRDQFVFGANRSTLALRPPAHMLTPAALPSPIGQLFERAFGPSKSGVPGGGRNRPSGREWADVLGALPIRRCTSNPLHAFPESAGTCPWCRIQREGGPSYFNVVVPSSAGTTDQVERLWQLIVGKRPATLKIRALSEYSVPVLQPTPLPAGLHSIHESFQDRLLLVCFGVSPVNPAYIQERSRRQALVGSTRTALDKAVATAATMPAEYQQRWAAKRNELEVLHRKYLSLASERTDELRKLELGKRELLLNQFLDSCLIVPNVVNGIGHSRKAVLNSHGIESALDIVPNMRVSGIGPTLLAALLVWRRQMEARFVYNPTAPLPATVVAALDQRQRDARLIFEAKLREGPVDLDRLAGYAQQAIERLEASISGLVRTHAQAVADLQHAPEIISPKEGVNRQRMVVGLVLIIFILLLAATQRTPEATLATSPSTPHTPVTSLPPTVLPQPTTTVQPTIFPTPTPTKISETPLYLATPLSFSTPPPSSLPEQTPLKTADKFVLRAEALTYQVVGVSTTDTLNVRTGPGERYPVVTRLPSSTKGIQIMGVARLNGQDAWVPIRSEAQTGWVIQRFLAAE